MPARQFSYAMQMFSVFNDRENNQVLRKWNNDDIEFCTVTKLCMYKFI